MHTECKRAVLLLLSIPCVFRLTLCSVFCLNNTYCRFLWVDYQLRELCKLSFESDIRARLGKLPKNLSGVYDEIMSSIESRPGTDFEFATRALKWMLVARTPLKPEELVAATQIDPSTSPGCTLLEPSLDVERVVHVCGGLIILDHELQVMRFAHLSGQEYLETRNGSWGIIDAQRFVSEGCLWTLQREPSLQTGPYSYAYDNWFRHCRSYQDIALSHNSQDPNHALDIPLLNTFLGSFDSPSMHFTKWVTQTSAGFLDGDIPLFLLVQSRPLRPAFAAAVCGLGELISWLWHSEGADMNIKNNQDYSLLYLASRYGTPWIMSCMIARGPHLDINEVCNSGTVPSGTALSGAVRSGILEKAALLLDEGADINLTSSGDYGTALGAAAASGNIEMATLLLSRGADINLIPRGRYGTALCVATYYGKREMATLLLDRGADINLTSSGVFGTAIGTAAFWGNLGVAKLLLDRGADINLISGGEYGTALCVASYWARKEMATLLLDRGANINQTFDGAYGTALAAAAVSPHGGLEIARLLLDRGANPNLTLT